VEEQVLGPILAEDEITKELTKRRSIYILALQRFHTVLNPASRRADNQACLSGGVEI